MAVSDLRDLRVEGDQDHRGLKVGRGPFHEIENFRSVFRVEVAGGLVGKEDGGLVHQGTGDGDSLHLSARKFCGKRVGPMPESDIVEQGFNALAIGSGGVRQQKRQFHIFHNREGWHEVEKLEHDTDLFSA